MKNLDVFIKGEIVDLCVPTIEFAEESNWYSWFNDPDITRFLDQGVWPNTSEQQVDFLKSTKHDRLLLVIRYQDVYVGVVSFSSINLLKGSAEIAIVVNKKLVKNYDQLIPLEAIARLTEHGFKSLNFKRISAGQHIALSLWQQRLELLGYKLEGIKENGFSKGIELANSVWIAVTKENFDLLKEIRGDYWDSAKRMRNRIECLPSVSYHSMLEKFVSKKGADHYKSIFNL